MHPLPPPVHPPGCWPANGARHGLRRGVRHDRAVAILVLGWLAAAPGVWAEPVELELVLAVDSSFSVDLEEFDLQMEGLAGRSGPDPIPRRADNGRWRSGEPTANRSALLSGPQSGTLRPYANWGGMS